VNCDDENSVSKVETLTNSLIFQKKVTMRKGLACFFMLFMLTAAAQKRMNQCGFIIPDNVMLPPNRFASVYEASNYIYAMRDSIHWNANFKVQEQNGINNAYATMQNGQRWIVYDNEFLEKIDYMTGSKWSSISVLAHEMGHHYRNHVIDGKGSTPAKELEADFFSGYIMARLGATLDEAKAAMQKIASDQGSSSHPPKAERLTAITQGWNYAKTSNTTTPSAGSGNSQQGSQGTTKPNTTPPPSVPPTTNPQTDMSWIYLQNYSEQPMTVYLSDDGRKFDAVELKPGEPFVFKFEIYQYGWMRLVNSPTAKTYKLLHYKDYSIVWSRRNRNWLVVEIP
jgi:hypothetical protein